MFKKTIETPFDLLKYLQDIDYGYIDTKGKRHADPDDEFASEYRLMPHDNIEKNKVGICWDLVEVERYYFNQLNIDFTTFFIVYYDKDMLPSHTFLVFYDNDKVYWFEHSWKKYIGIHEYDDLESLICDVKNKFISSLEQESIDENCLCLYEYLQPSVGITADQFYKYAEKQGPIELLWKKDK